MRLRSLTGSFLVLLLMTLAACSGSGLPRPRPNLEAHSPLQLTTSNEDEPPPEGPPAMGRPVGEITKSGMVIYRGSSNE